MTPAQATPDVLLVEDNPGDAELFRLAFEESELPGTLHEVADGAAALAFLRDEAGPDSAPPVDIIVLDLNLPEVHGTEVLAEIRADPALRRTPVLILSTSDADDDINEAYDLGANAYMTKPMAFDDTVALVDALDSFWFTVGELPTA